LPSQASSVVQTRSREWRFAPLTGQAIRAPAPLSQLDPSEIGDWSSTLSKLVMTSPLAR